MSERIKKRIEELRREVVNRNQRLKQFAEQNAMRIESEKAIIQQKLGAIQELEVLLKPEKEGTNGEKDNKPKGK